MSDLYGEFLDALHEVQRASGLGAIRLRRLLGVSRDTMKSLHGPQAVWRLSPGVSWSILFL